MVTKMNSYLGIADNDLMFLRAVLAVSMQSGYFNHIAIQSAQVVEKSLKAIAEIKLVDNDEINGLLRTSNLRKIAQALNSIDGIPQIDLVKCKFVGDFYFDVQYPGDDFIAVDYDTAVYCIECAEEINRLAHEILDNRECHGMGMLPELKDLKFE